MPRLTVILTVLSKELRELLRDRRSLLVMFGVPLLVYPLLLAGFGAIARTKASEARQGKVAVAVVNGDDAPELMRRLAAPEQNLDLRPVPADQLDAQLRDEKLAAVLVVPEDAERKLLAMQPLSVRPSGAPPPTTAPTTQTAGGFEVRLDRSRGKSDAGEARLRAVLNGYEKWVLEKRLAERGVGAELLSPLPRNTVDIATRDQRLGRFLAQLLPVLLLVTGMLGAFFPALNATTTERELGTLETLLVSPVSRAELLLAKGALVFACSIVTAGLNLVSMSAVFANIAGSANQDLGAMGLNPGSIALAFLSVVPSLVLFSAVVLCVGLMARTYREANSFAAPVMMLPMAAMAIGMADPATTPALLATPIANTTVLIRDILTARFTWGNFALAAGANLMLAAAVISVATRLFTNEQLVNPAWEPLSLKGFRKKGAAAVRRLPSIDEALVLIALGVLVQFYAGPWLGKLYTAGKIDVFTLVTLLLTGAFLVPPVLAGLLFRYDWRETFSLRPPTLAAAAGGLLLGLGLMPLLMGYSQFQAWLFPAEPSDAARSIAKIIGSGFESSPWATALLLGIVPGICEEVLFRGVVLSALRKRMTSHAAVWITAVLFAAVHMDAAGFLPRTVLGAALGYVTLRSGSLLPAILLHAAYNASQVGLIAHYLGPTATSTTQPSDVPAALQPTSPEALIRLGLGVVLTGASLAIWKLSPRAGRS